MVVKLAFAETEEIVKDSIAVYLTEKNFNKIVKVKFY